MNVLRRFLLCLCSLATIAVAAAVGVCAFSPEATRFSLDRLYRFLTEPYYFYWLLLAAVVLLLWGLFSFFVSLAKKPAPAQVVVGTSEGGQVNISLDAVDNVVRKAALSVDGVKNVESHIKATKNGVAIKLKISLPHDTSVPNTSTAIQTEVKKQLDMVVGLTAVSVAILVSAVEGRATKIGNEQIPAVSYTHQLPEIKE
ncbi:MAG: alkaline shock response membrane anchor protein AmaP [Clostridiales bacterium]|nr:alkaline shock response membrane anchor protein AmaP [Clostridiales bacterium]